jgi:N-acetylglucosamine-6-phosphate deacetylase
MRMNRFALKARTVMTPIREIEQGVVIVEDGKITGVGSLGNVQVPEGIPILDFHDRIISPGYIDIHHHGAVGERAQSGSEAIKKIAAFLPSTGCTAWLPTVNQMEHCPPIVVAMKSGTGGADVPGINMEGPFHAPKNLPGRRIKLDGALDVIRAMRRLDILPSVAHTKTTYDRFMEAVDAGLGHATHVYKS